MKVISALVLTMVVGMSVAYANCHLPYCAEQQSVTVHLFN
jgi:hypothetical protein